MLHLRQTAYGGARPPRDSHTLALTRRSEPLRCCLMALLSLGVGAVLALLLLPADSAEGTASLVGAHVAGAGEPWRFWLNLCRARLPFWLLTALAGLTRFSGGLTSAVLVWRGLCDGAALALLGTTAPGRAELALPAGLTAGELTVALAVWCFLDTVIRLLQTVAARRLARFEPKAPRPDGRMEPRLREALMRYAAVSIMLLGACAGGCAGYAALITVFQK